jgi:dolichol-phosphate mannosyltransferase
MQAAPMNKLHTLIFTATYNEADNIGELIEAISSYAPEADILVVDDASPDNTGGLLERLAGGNPRLRVVHRPRKAGLGSAHMLAMKRAISEGYDALVTMDADFFHNPSYLPMLLMKLQGGEDFVIGSRYTQGGGCDYGFLRQLLSRGANTVAIWLLGIRLKESTTSYRAFRVSTLKRLSIDEIRSTGYSFFVETVYRIGRLTDRIAEIPIHFEDRRAGTSKISKWRYSRASSLYSGSFLTA